MGEVKDLKVSEIVLIDIDGKMYLGECHYENGEIVTNTLFNPVIMGVQLIPQQSKLGGVSFATITNMFAFGVETLNIEYENLIWGIVEDEITIKQYKDTIKEMKNRKTINA